MKPILLISLLASIAVTTVGCRSFLVDRTPVELVPARTNLIQVLTTNVVVREVWTTNQVVIPQSTNSSGVVLPSVIQLMPVRDLVSTALVQTNLQSIVLPAVYYTNVVLGSGVAGAITMAGDMAPVPWGGLAGEALVGLAGLVFGVVNLFAKRKALKAAGEAQTNAELYKDASVVLVKNVEQVRQAAIKTAGYTPAMDRNVMRGIQAIQGAAKVSEVIAGIVNEHTGETYEEANRPG